MLPDKPRLLRPVQTLTKRGQLPLKLRKGGKRDIRGQFAALCFRKSGDRVEICVVTSRRRGRWILPKGWPMHKQTPAEAAATEAWEEAGLRGRPINHCLGVYAYNKQMRGRFVPVVVMVYPLLVEDVAKDWPEAKQRKRKWLRPAKAAKRLEEPALREIVKRFDPAALGL